MIDSTVEEAFELLTEGEDNLFITGGAGCGKSTLLLKFIECGIANTAVLAPTGVAAVNIGGQTIHSFFKFTKGNVCSDKNTFDLCAELKIIIIDEISMVRADLIDAIDEVMKQAKKSKLPFGGVRMIFFGDLFQLPPVVTKFGDEKEIFKGFYNSPFFFDAHIFDEFKYKIINLPKIFRQVDTTFVDILNKIRIGNIDYSTLTYINRICKKSNPIKDSVFLSNDNNSADNINYRRLNEIESDEFVNFAKITGKIDPKQIQADEKLILKTGARVMFLNNDKTNQWVNGTLGTFLYQSYMTITKWNAEEKKEEELEVKCLRVRLDCDTVVSVPTYTWQVNKLILNEDYQIKSVEVGSFSQFPVKLAWAFTIHKSQGKTYDAVSLKLDPKKPMYTPGQLYVALSRVRNIESLAINRPLRISDVVVNKRVIKFFNEQIKESNG